MVLETLGGSRGSGVNRLGGKEMQNCRGAEDVEFKQDFGRGIENWKLEEKNDRSRLRYRNCKRNTRNETSFVGGSVSKWWVDSWARKEEKKKSKFCFVFELDTGVK